ncbi:sigma-E factor negative regulatory protein [Biformimicrobium ophioploci]|uniref:Anti sigma-E factor RseA C-terminal domain-containing protein n=1 Tax=Biformimicrobium ophioploci TaxID=3036711 RepID=A0ABQ6LZX6_9GAMM|nr:sigma-E factor negative regulatory protein [Microbulbifer sp. NKW57]GMG87592.1 anti sigma-E factor RseA C-terminal domain-containing protein [Microbulbifer sp. NKW57]
MTRGNEQESLFESLSALMDGEASEFEVRRVLKAMVDDPDGELAQRWSRMQLASGAMARDAVCRVPAGLAGSISAAIAEEAPDTGAAGRGASSGPSDNPASNDPTWWRPFGRGAVAAAVAFVAILGVREFGGQPAGTSDLAAAPASAVQQTVQSTPQPTGFAIPTPTARLVSAGAPAILQPRIVPDQSAGVVQRRTPPPELMLHLNRVMAQHAEQSALTGTQGLLPYARAGYSAPEANKAPQQEQEDKAPERR